MLVHKKQDWLYEEQAPWPVPEPEQKQNKKDEIKINRSLRSKCLILVLTVAVLSAVVTMQSAYIVKSGYHIVETKQQILRMERANEALRLDIANLKAPDRIASIASQKLGMIVPQNAYFSSGESSHYADKVSETPAQAPASGLAVFNFSGKD